MSDIDLHTRATAATSRMHLTSDVLQLVDDLDAALRAAETDLATARTIIERCIAGQANELAETARSWLASVASTPTATDQINRS